MSLDCQGVAVASETDPLKTLSGYWIWCPAPYRPAEPQVVLFRRTIDIDDPDELRTLRISADAIYKLYVNGHMVNVGPAKNTPEYHSYDVIDIADYLVAGKNIVAIQVYWYGQKAPQNQVSLHPGLWCMIGDKQNPARVVTDESWKLLKSKAHELLDLRPEYRKQGLYTVVAAPEYIDYRCLPNGWQERDFDDSAWRNAPLRMTAVAKYQPANLYTVFHELVPREIPLMDISPIDGISLLQSGTIEANIEKLAEKEIVGPLTPDAQPRPAEWIAGSDELELSENACDYFVLDMGKLRTGFIRFALQVEGEAFVELQYSEALSRDWKKGVRDDPSGRVQGYADVFTVADDEFIIEPFAWRTFRYLQIAVYHPGATVTLKGLDVRQVNYPLEQESGFDTDDETLNRIWDVSWHTALLCAHDTYDDCPYYEQLQYVTDSRLQALVSYLVGGDFRLARQALKQFARSRRADGIIPSRAPSAVWRPQVIPDFALSWVEFLDDFRFYSGDVSLVRELWDTLEGNLKWFEQFVRDDVLADVPYWLFTDWTYPRDEKRISGSIGVLNMRYVGALTAAARLAEAIDRPDRAAAFARQAERIANGIKTHFYDSAAGLFCDDPDGTIVGEHPSVLAVYYGMVDGDEARQLLSRAEQNEHLAQMTPTFCYFKFRAYERVGRYEKAFADNLRFWTDQLDLHTTTWFENPDPSRSDCHAWSSWIMCDFLTCLLGIKPQRPGFEKVLIAPAFGLAPSAGGSLLTVRGRIAVDWQNDNGTIQCRVTIPSGIEAAFRNPQGNQRPLQEGEQLLTLTL